MTPLDQVCITILVCLALYIVFGWRKDDED